MSVDIDEYNAMAERTNLLFEQMANKGITCYTISVQQIADLRWMMNHQILIREVGVDADGERLFVIGEDYASLVEGVDWVFGSDKDTGVLSIYGLNEPYGLPENLWLHVFTPGGGRLDYDNLKVYQGWVRVPELGATDE